MTVAIDPGPANRGIANGTIATSSFDVASDCSGPEVLVCDGRPRSMSSEVIKSRIPPATLNALSVTPSTLNKKPPKIAKNTSTPAPTRQARNAMSRTFDSGSPAVIAKKIGTTPNGSTTKKIAESVTAKWDRNSDKIVP